MLLDPLSLASSSRRSVSRASPKAWDYFQNGFFNPAGANALSTFASVPVSSEIFSSNNREDGAFNSSPG